MEHLENDMDDLFQRAGEHYPLKTSGSDWDAVLGKLSEEGFGDHSGIPGSNVKSSRNKRRWLFLLLLIPIGFGSVNYFLPSKKLSSSSATNIVKSNFTKKHEASAIRSGRKSGSVNSDQGVEKTSNNSLTQQELPDSKLNKETVNASNSHIKSENPINGNTESLMRTEAHRNKNGSRSITAALTTTNKESMQMPLLTEYPEYSQMSLAQPLAKKHLSVSVPESNETISVKGKTLSKAASVPVNIVSPTTNAKSKINKGIYVGFIGGPDLSTVKLQSVEQLGYSLGAVVGYRINKHLSFETGLFWDKKYYYTEGKYFSKDQLYVPPSSHIVNVNGNCNMFEIPISVRYDFASSPNHGFFISSGFSSYLMRQQNYTAIVANSSSQWPAPFSSDSPSNYFFSIIQLSTGYEFAISGKTKIRIEPYVKIPLEGIGIGSLPISSTGLYLGITHSFR